MGSKEVYSHYLLEVKHEYTKQLCNLLVPVMYEGILSIYSEAKKARKDAPMKMFQLALSKVPTWSQNTIITEYNRIINKTDCEWINELITAVFISHAKILSSIKTKKKSKTLNLKIPNGDYFIHKAYIECARQFWKNPYLFYDGITTVEYQRNLREAELIIQQCIEETIRKLLPVRNILQQYIAVDEESSSSSSSSSSESESESEHETKKHSSKKTKAAAPIVTNDEEEDDVTQTITEKQKRLLQESVKKNLSSNIKQVEKPVEDDNFSNYSVSQDIPAKSRKKTKSKEEKSVDTQELIQGTGKIEIVHAEPSLSTSIPESEPLKEPYSEQGDIQIKNITDDDIAASIVPSVHSIASIRELSIHNPSIHETSNKAIVNNITKTINLDRSVQDLMGGELYNDLDQSNSVSLILGDKKKTRNVARSEQSQRTEKVIRMESHDDEHYNLEGSNLEDSNPDEIEDSNPDEIEGSEVEHYNLEGSNEQENDLATQSKHTELLDELEHYPRKIVEEDLESLNNPSMDFDIRDPKSFIDSRNRTNVSREHSAKIPIKLSLDNEDIEDLDEKDQSVKDTMRDVKTIKINTPLRNVDDEPQERKLVIKRKNEKKGYSFF
jgi:hypothetical protein